MGNFLPYPVPIRIRTSFDVIRPSGNVIEGTSRVNGIRTKINRLARRTAHLLGAVWPP